MAAPRNNSYAVASGAGVYAGRANNLPPATVAFVGDSLTDPSYNVSPWYWALGVCGGVLAPIINAGVSGNTYANIQSRIDNAYTNASPGLGSAPEALGWVFLRAGTNNARSAAINGTTQGQIDALIASCLTYAARVVLFAIPPLGGAEAANNARVPAYNAYLASKANGSTVFFVDGTAGLYTGADQNGAYFSDGIHFNSAGTMRCGLDEGAALASLLSGYASPVDSAAASSTTQWHPNPQNVGAGGSIGTGFTGTLPNGYSISRNGASHAAACSIVASSDANPTPWADIAPSAFGATGGIRVALTPAGRAVGSSDPGPLDVVVEVRFVGFDCTKITDFRTWLQCPSGNRLFGSGANTEDLKLSVGIDTALTQTVVLRAKLKRATASSESAPTLYVDLRSAGAASGSMGSVRMRCFTIKG